MQAEALFTRWALVAWASAAIGFEVGIARFTYGATLPYAQSYFGFSFGIGGLIGALHLVGYLGGTLASPRLVRRLRLLPVSRGAHVAFIACLAWCGIAQTPWSLALARIALGVSAGICVSTVIVIVMNDVAAEARTWVSATLWSGPGVAIALMGSALPVYAAAAENWRLAWLVPAVAAVGLLVAFPGARGGGVARAPPARARDGASATSRYRWVVVAYFLFGFAYLSFATFLSSRLYAAALPVRDIAAIWVAFGAASIAGGWLGVKCVATPRLRRYALAWGLLMGGVGALVACVDALAALVVGALLVGLGIASTPAVVTASIRERTTEEGYLSAFSLATAATAAGQILGPACSGVLADALGPTVIPAFAAIVYGLGAAAALLDTA